MATVKFQLNENNHKIFSLLLV